MIAADAKDREGTDSAAEATGTTAHIVKTSTRDKEKARNLRVGLDLVFMIVVLSVRNESIAERTAASSCSGARDSEHMFVVST